MELNKLLFKFDECSHFNKIKLGLLRKRKKDKKGNRS